MKNFNEKELVNKLDRILKKQFGTNLAFHEFSAGYGIADLVFAPNVSFKKESIQRIPLTNFNTFRVLLSLQEKKSYNISEIQKAFSDLSTNELKKSLVVLVRYGYLNKLSKDIYIKATYKTSLNPIKKIVAIEVKLSDHKGGLMQARRYQYFADESYLAILKEAEKNINFDEFNKHNIGLILFDSKKNKIEIKQPQKNSFTNEQAINLFAKEIMLSRFLSFAS